MINFFFRKSPETSWAVWASSTTTSRTRFESSKQNRLISLNSTRNKKSYWAGLSFANSIFETYLTDNNYYQIFFEKTWGFLSRTLNNLFYIWMCEQVFNGSYGSEEENRLEENLDQVEIENKKLNLEESSNLFWTLKYFYNILNIISLSVWSNYNSINKTNYRSNTFWFYNRNLCWNTQNRKEVFEQSERNGWG